MLSAEAVFYDIIGHDYLLLFLMWRILIFFKGVECDKKSNNKAHCQKLATATDWQGILHGEATPGLVN